MKKMKKLVALIIATAMVLSMMSIAAFAAPTDTTLKVNPVEGHTYTAYQLFVGDLSAGKLSNVKWGTDVASSITYKKDGADVTISPVKGGDVPQDVLDYLTGLDDKTEATDNVAQATADIISEWVTGTGTTLTAENVTVKTGYYVVKDAYTNPAADQTTTLSTVICEVVGPTTVTPKAGETTHKKDVLDVNDTTDIALDLTKLKDVADADWAKSADHDFGDKVPFRLTTKIGTDFAKYDEYYLGVTDTLGAGLKLNEDSIEVYVDGHEATKGPGDGNYSVTVTGQTFKVEFEKLNGNTNAAAGKDVVIYYTATLDKDTAVIGNYGNPNESYAEFSNNPNGDQSGKGKTPEDTVVVFTYKTDVDKVDPEGEALEGAGFTLYKQYKAAVEGGTNVAGTTPAGAQATTFPAGEFWYAVGNEVSGATNFEFKGIDDGTYMLVESTTPATYNTMAPIKFTVTATHEKSTGSDTGYAITALTVDNSTFKAAANGGEIKFTKKNNTEKELASGEIYGEIVNKQGSTLPSTGGIGTTIFYVIGAILVIGAGVVLVTRRRMEA